ncbi:MAG: hypothetical protein QXX08_08840 [Candidatus Bathyarchaeia archaeon]
MSLLHSGKISQNTFDLLDKNVNRLSSAIMSLKEAFNEEETFWKPNRSEEARVLELILLDFKVRHLLGDIGEDEWKQKSDIIKLGLDSLRGIENTTRKADLESVQTIQFSNKDGLIEDAKTNLETENNSKLSKKPLEKKKEPIKKKHRQTKHRKRDVKEPPNLDRPITSELHCMNPWKPGCRRTDVELTIYYKGQPTPICHECWEEISKKDIEWSGL